MTHRRTPSIGAGGSRIRHTKGGGRRPPARADLVLWRQCFASAIAGATAAQRRLPNPDLLVRWAAKVASRAVEECHNHYA